MSFHVPERYRMVDGPLATSATDGNNGAFVFPSCIPGRTLIMIASDGKGWDHVSVHAEQSRKYRTPVWDEMDQVKRVFWDDDDVVMQLHARRSEWVNNHRNTLHLWRPNDGRNIPTPESILVGVQALGDITDDPKTAAKAWREANDAPA